MRRGIENDAAVIISPAQHRQVSQRTCVRTLGVDEQAVELSYCIFRDVRLIEIRTPEVPVSGLRRKLLHNIVFECRQMETACTELLGINAKSMV